MVDPGFIHLRVHSAYSLSEGAIQVDRLVSLARDHAMPAVAMTDSNNLFGALEFAQAAAKAGVQPIIGCQLALTRLDAAPPPGSARRTQTVAGPAPDSIVLLVQDATGYANLLKLVSRAHLDTPSGETPQVAVEDLTRHAAGLICLTGGTAGPLGRPLGEGRADAAAAALDRMAAIFPGRLYVELQRHGLPEEDAVEPGLIELAIARDVPLVATNEPFFPEPAMHAAHDALLCIAEGAYISQDDRRTLTPEHCFKSAAEMRDLFADLPEAVDNTGVVARRCAYFPEPAAPMLPPYDTAAGRDEATELSAQARAGLDWRLESQVLTADMDAGARERAAAPYRARLDHELDVIARMGFPGYFLIVADFIQWAKGQGIPVGPGRGSGAGSVVAWALSITDLDPLRFDLLFERFLNPERVSMPDFDIDFCQERRDEVIAYVQRKYGTAQVAQIITFGKLQARAALRDVGRVLQMPFKQVDRICKLVPNNPANPVTLAEAIAGEPQLQALREEDETVAYLMDIAQKIEGLYRHASTHAAGVVIGDRPLDELVPLYRDPRADMPVTQFNMKDVEKAGLVKFDFLGLKTLTVLARACYLLDKRDIPIDLSRIPLDDPATYAILSRGETVGVFQLESAGMRDVLKRLKPDRFEDIIAVVALYRPGPMDNIPAYIDRKQGREPVDYLHPALEGVLKETFGIMIYQEQVMQAAQELAGYSLGAADLLRRAMGKKIQSEMDKQRRSFVDGAVARGVAHDRAEAIFDQIAKFAGYGFNKSHAAAYALVAYQTAYLKANYPVAFMAAIMTYDMANTDKLNLFRQELDRMGIPLLGPDVNSSQADFDIEETPDGRAGVRYALGAIRNVGHGAMAALAAARDAEGPFRDLGDLVARLDPRQINKRQVEMLACAGAFDSLTANRHQAYAGAEMIVRHASAAAQERQSDQSSLFALADGSTAPAPPLRLPDVEDWPAMERLRHEFDAIGFYLSAHPLDSYGSSLTRLRVVPVADIPKLQQIEPGRKKVAGIVVAKQERRAKTSGNRFAFVQLSDHSGVFEVVVFSELLARCRDLMTPGQPLLVTVDARSDEDGLRLAAAEIEDLDQAVSQAAAGLRVHLRDTRPVARLQTILAREGRGRGRVSVVLGLDQGEEVELALPGGYRLSPQTRQALKMLPGVTVQDV